MGREDAIKASEMFNGRDPLDHPLEGDAGAKAALEGLLGKRLVVTLTDGRRIAGDLYCIDPQRNIIVENGSEYRSEEAFASGKSSRQVGTVLVPHFRQARVQVGAADAKGLET